jgi:LysR family transcriptional activator of nhaA
LRGCGQLVERQFDVRKIARVPGVTERFYGISGERRIKHLAVVAIAEAAKRALFI